MILYVENSEDTTKNKQTKKLFRIEEFITVGCSLLGAGAWG